MLGSLLTAMQKATVSSSVSFNIDCSNRAIILLSKKPFTNSGECPEGLKIFLSKDFPVLLQYVLRNIRVGSSGCRIKEVCKLLVD